MSTGPCQVSKIPLCSLFCVFCLLLKGYGDNQLPRKTLDQQSHSNVMEQDNSAVSEFITAKQKLVGTLHNVTSYTHFPVFSVFPVFLAHLRCHPKGLLQQHGYFKDFFS